MKIIDIEEFSFVPFLYLDDGACFVRANGIDPEIKRTKIGTCALVFRHYRADGHFIKAGDYAFCISMHGQEPRGRECDIKKFDPAEVVIYGTSPTPKTKRFREHPDTQILGRLFISHLTGITIQDYCRLYREDAKTVLGQLKPLSGVPRYVDVRGNILALTGEGVRKAIVEGYIRHETTDKARREGYAPP